MKYVRNHLLSITYIFLIAVFFFMYFIVYRTDSRVAWYNEMHNQTENLIREFRKLIGIKQ